FLPSFFPFTEPSVEFAMSCVFCRGAGCNVCSRTGWVELGGAGMVDPNVFVAAGIDPERYTGFAFGFGIGRLVPLLYGVDHDKTLWDGAVRFARQFGGPAVRAPLSWIRDFTPLDATDVDGIADALNQLGLEVEAIDAPGRDINGVVAARILDVVPHPDAD